VNIAFKEHLSSSAGGDLLLDMNEHKTYRFKY
jgi:hypothetical protein